MFPLRSIKNKLNTELFLLLPMLLFKISCDAGYYFLLRSDPVSYPLDFNLLKYIIGTAWCLVLFFGIDHNEKKASTFLFYLFFLLQIIPITTVYALKNENTVFYTSLCMTTFLSEMLVRHVGFNSRIISDLHVSRLIVFFFAAMAAFTVFRMIQLHGRPSTTALNIYKVYTMRADAKTIGKLLNYLLSWTVTVFLPFGIARAVTKKNYILSLILCGIMLLLYLYTGHKTYLFAVPMVFGITVWARRENCYRELFALLCIGFVFLVIFGCLERNNTHGIFHRVYSLFGRRSLFDPAVNKFNYYDYFSKRPLMGIDGIFPRWLFNLEGYYKDIPYTYEISRIYYGKPDMNSNTGFLAEGFMRFGHAGTIMVMVLFALILKLSDRFAEKTSYQLAVGALSYRVFSLADAHLIDSLFFGEWMFWILLMLFYSENIKRKKNIAEI